jgi:hypothetical protein
MASPESVRLFEQIYAKVDKQVREIVATMLPDVDIAAQDDGTVIANDHRILNFQGPGVVVSDEPALRRANVYVPGAPVASSTTTAASSTTAKAKSLWVGTGASIVYTANGSEGGGASLGSTALSPFTGPFTVTVTSNAPNTNIINMGYGFYNSGTSANCWFDTFTLTQPGGGMTVTSQVGNPPASWHCSDWDTLSWGMGGATDHLLAGVTYVLTVTPASGGGSNSAPPANWDQPSYSDSSWGAAVVAGMDAGDVAPSGSSAVWATSAPASTTEEVLFRHTFNLPTGTLATASLDLAANDTLADNLTHVNGGTVSTPLASAGAIRTFSIPISMLTAGGSNVLAYWGKNTAGTKAWVGWRLTVGYVAGGTDTQYIPKSIVTTKGDLIAGTGTSTPVRHAVGTDGYVLTARSSATNGVAWEAAAGGGGSGTAATHQEFLPAASATTVTLSASPTALLLVTRQGVVQSATDGNYSLSGATLTFTDAFDGTERVVVVYATAGISSSPLTTKGDVYVYGSSDARLPVGTDTQVLTADSTQSTGLKWAAAGGGGGMVHIGTVTLTSSQPNITFSSIPTTYRHLLIEAALQSDIAGSTMSVVNTWLNGDTTLAHYKSDATASSNRYGITGQASAYLIPSRGVLYNYASATVVQKVFSCMSGRTDGTADQDVILWNPTSAQAVTQIQLLPASGNFIAPSVAVLYGLP